MHPNFVLFMKNYLYCLMLAAIVPFGASSCAKKKMENTTGQAQPIKPIDPADREKQNQTAAEEKLRPNENGLMPHQPSPDAPNYDELKRQWVEQYPEEYQYLIDANNQANQNTGNGEQMQNADRNPTPNSPGIIILKRSEFNRLPAEKQQYVLAHPELYKIVED